MASSGASLGRPGRKQEVAEQGGGGARGGVAVSVLLAEEEEDKGEEEVGWAGQMGWPAGPGKWRQVIPFSLCLFLIISVFYFAGLF